MLKIDFVDFWPNFRKNDNYFYHLLKTKYTIEINDTDPDLIFCSCYSNHKNRYSNHRCKKIFYTGENRGLLCHNGEAWHKTQFNYDLTFTFDETTGQNVYLPLFVMFLNWFNVDHDDNRDISYLHNIQDLLDPIKDIDSVLKHKSKFCSFIVGNNTASLRIQFCQEMQKRSHVDCPGTVLNNTTPIGGRGDQRHKVDYLKNYRFNIAFENSAHPGYITEKILHALAARCVPIYWGGSKVTQYFMPNSFIHVKSNEFASIINHVLSINTDQYTEMIRYPVMNADVMIEFEPAKILEHIVKVL